MPSDRSSGSVERNDVAMRESYVPRASCAIRPAELMIVRSKLSYRDGIRAQCDPSTATDRSTPFAGSPCCSVVPHR